MMWGRVGKPGLLCGLVLALAGCGGGDDPGEPPDPLAVYREQALAWSDCPATQPAPATEPWQSRVQCAQVRVPRDYADPAAGDIEVGILRVAAEHGGTQRKALFFNPGGPGGDGLRRPERIAALWNASTDATEAGRLQRELARTYDLIGFSPRGLGASTVLTCTSSTPLAPTDESVTGNTPDNIRQQLRNLQRIAQACAENPLTAHIHTEATVQDMDLIRGLLGDSAFNFIGWSYGTWLGAWYGARFPERVGRMLLDSSVDMDATLHDTYLLQPAALTRAFDEVLAPYAARHPAAFGLGSDVAAIRAAFGQVHPALQQAVSSQLYSPLFASRLAPEVFDRVRVAGILSQPPFVAHWPTGIQGGDFAALQALLETHTFDADPAVDARLRDVAVEATLQVRANVRPRALHLSDGDAVYTAVVCNDTPPPTADAQWWIEQQTRIHQQFPLVSTDDLRSCLYWARPAGVDKPAISAMADVPVLMVQAQYDGATPEAGARRTFAQLPKASLVYVTGEMTHGVYPYRDDCVDVIVARYLLGTAPAARETTCVGHPLPLDAARQAASSRAFSRPSASGTYRDPAAAQAITEALQSAIHERASRARH